MLFSKKLAFVLSLLVTTSDAQNQGCERIVTRPNIKSLSPQQVKDVIDAIYQVHANKPVLHQLTKIHFDHKAEAHGVPAFLPWHRHYIREFEKEMQKVNPSVVLPFWDWSRDSQEPEKSFIFTAEYFGGNGSGRNKCIPNGRFANLEVTYPNPHCLARSFNDGNTISSFYSPESVERVIATSRSFDVFRRTLEGAPHGLVHNNIGGDGGDISTMYSTNDPIFWMHHAFIDLTWHEWQMRNPQLAKTYGGGNARASDIIRPYNVPVSAVFDTKSPGYCYQYPRYSAQVPPVDVEQPPPIATPAIPTATGALPSPVTTTPATAAPPASSAPLSQASQQPTRAPPSAQPTRPQPTRNPPVPPTDERPTRPISPPPSRPPRWDFFDDFWNQIFRWTGGNVGIRFVRRDMEYSPESYKEANAYPIYPTDPLPIPTTSDDEKNQYEVKTTDTPCDCDKNQPTTTTTCNGDKDQPTPTSCDGEKNQPTTTEVENQATTTPNNDNNGYPTIITSSGNDNNGYPTIPIPTITTIPSYPTLPPTKPNPPPNSTPYDQLTPENAGPRLRQLYHQIPQMSGYLSPKDRNTHGKIRVPNPLPNRFIEMNGLDPLEIRNHELDIAIMCAKLNNDKSFTPEVKLGSGTNSTNNYENNSNSNSNSNEINSSGSNQSNTNNYENKSSSNQSNSSNSNSSNSSSNQSNSSNSSGSNQSGSSSSSSNSNQSSNSNKSKSESHSSSKSESHSSSHKNSSSSSHSSSQNYKKIY